MDKNIKVYMLSSNYGGCYMVRQYLPMIHNNWTGDYLKVDVDRDKRERAKDALSADVIVAHRLDDPAKHDFIDLMKNMGKKIVVDNDDTTIMEEVGSLAKYMAYQGLVHSGFRKADMVTCSTEFLKKEYENYNKNVIVLPNCIDFDFIPKEKVENKTNKVRIGIIGSSTYKEDLEDITDILLELNDRKDVKLIIYGLISKEDRKARNAVIKPKYREDFDVLDSLTNAEWVSWTPMSEYYNTVNNLGLDFVLINRKDNYFNRCKSNLKYLEMSAMKIPCICSSFSDKNSPYDKDIDGTNGILCKTKEEWKTAINLMIKDSKVRKEMALKAFSYVAKNYNIKDKAHLWADTYKKLL